MDEQRMERENDDSARRMEMEEQRMEMEQQRMESEDALRREQMTLQSEREDKDREERREMEQQQRQQQTAREDRETKERREMEQQRMEREDVDRKERMEMERQRMAMDQQRMGSGQPGVQPVAGERPKSGPGRGLFSNSKAGEATSGIDNIMDPGMLTIIGIALTVLTTGMTLFKGD
jgi:Flp pilus assembly protein TadB